MGREFTKSTAARSFDVAGHTKSPDDLLALVSSIMEIIEAN